MQIHCYILRTALLTVGFTCNAKVGFRLAITCMLIDSKAFNKPNQTKIIVVKYIYIYIFRHFNINN